MIHLHSLGQCMITLGATRLVPTARLMFASALYVAIEGTRSLARDRMASLLWPEFDEERATHALRQVFYRLRSHGVSIDGDAAHVVLPAGTVRTDYEDLLAPTATVPVSEMLTRIPGGFLPGYMPTVSQPFAEWVETHRERVNSALRRQLVSGIQTLRGAGDWPATQALAERCLELDPLNEEATLAYAEAMAMDGSKARAIMIIDRYLNEIGPRAKELHLPATLLRTRISDLYPLPPVIERDPPHTGREAEMERLDAALKRARRGAGGAFLISGPPGMGKTRLVTEFTRAAQLQGIPIARSQMGRQDGHRPLGAWSDLATMLQRMPGAPGCDPESLPYLKRLTTYDSSPSAPSPESEDAEYLFARIRLAIIDLVGAVASESCVILLIEDVHWMDEWSWDVMTALTRRLEKTGVVILMTRRDGDESVTPVPAEAAIEGMPLAPLDEARCRKLLGLVGPDARLAEEDFVEWCVRTCAGNPYFLIELVRRASRSDGRFLAPPSLTRLIAQRFLDVAPLSRRVMQAAAVLGKSSTLARIEGVLAERRVSLLDSLDELVRHSLLVSEGERMLCRHDLLGMSALSEVSAPSLALLHRHAAMVLEAEVTEASSPEELWECAQHWEAAGERQRALKLIDLCVTRSLEVGVPTEAVRMLEVALSWLKSPNERESWQRRLIEVLHLTRDDSRLVDVYDDLCREAHIESDPISRHSRVELHAMDARHTCGKSFEIILERTVACALSEQASADHRVEAALIASKIANDVFQSEPARVAFDAVNPLVDSVEGRLAIHLRLVYEGSFGSIVECVHAARLLRRLQVEPVRLAARIRDFYNCAVGLTKGGHVSEAIDCATEGLELARSLRMPDAVLLSIQGLMRIHLTLGDVDAAESVWNRRGRAIDQGHDECRTSQEYLVRLALLRENDELALQLVQSVFLNWRPSWPRAVAHRAALEALPRLRLGRWRPDDAEMSHLLDVHRAARMFGGHDFFIYMLSYAWEVRGEAGEGLAIIDEYLATHRRELAPVLRQLSARISELRNSARPCSRNS